VLLIHNGVKYLSVADVKIQFESIV
jgi:hypothetical protein